MEVKGVSALVTGGGSGLGEAAAKALAAGGAKVAILDRNAEAAARVASEIAGVGVTADVTDPDGVERALTAAAADHGPARIVISCAGIGTAGRIVGRDGPLPLDRFADVINVNLIGTFNVLRLAAAAMSSLEPTASGERGVIINTTSVAAYEGQIGQAAYASSKGGIVSLTLPAARELARFGIRVMAIAPGIFLTPLLYSLPPEAQEALGKAAPFPNRLGQPAEFAKLIMHILDNEMLNGEVIRLDGALRLTAK